MRRSHRLLWLAALLTVTLGACTRQRSPDPLPGGLQEGIASWYGEPFHGRQTANGETYDMHGISAAHRTLPLGTVVEVTNLDNGRKLKVRINDRGPFVGKRILDLSLGAAKSLDMVQAGLAPIRLRVLRIGVIGPQARSPQIGTFTVQVGAFAERDRAQVRVEELSRLGYDSEIIRREDLFRVQVGKYDDRQAAEAIVRALAGQGMQALVIGLG
jgi:rare lipoprotein A